MHRTSFIFSPITGLLVICLSAASTALGMGDEQYPQEYGTLPSPLYFSPAFSPSTPTPCYINPHALHITPQQQPTIYQNNVHNQIYVNAMPSYGYSSNPYNGYNSGGFSYPSPTYPSQPNNVTPTNLGEQYFSHQPSYTNQLLYAGSHVSSFGHKRSHEDAFSTMPPQQHTYTYNTPAPEVTYTPYQYTPSHYATPHYAPIEHQPLHIAPSLSYDEQPQPKHARTYSDASDEISSTPSSPAEKAQELTTQESPENSLQVNMFGKFKCADTPRRSNTKKIESQRSAIQTGKLSVEQFINSIAKDKFHHATVARLASHFQAGDIDKIVTHLTSLDDSEAKRLPYKPELYIAAINRANSLMTLTRSETPIAKLTKNVSSTTFKQEMLETFVKEHAPAKASFDRYMRAMENNLTDAQKIAIARYHAQHPLERCDFQSRVESWLPENERTQYYASLDAAKLLDERNTCFIIKTAGYITYPANLFHTLMKKKNYLGKPFSPITLHNIASNINRHNTALAESIVTELTKNPLDNSTLQAELLKRLRRQANDA